MPSKQSSKSGGSKVNASGKGQKSSAASANHAAATVSSPAATAPSFDSLPHATSGERLKGVEVSATIPALMSELGVLLQQTPGGGSGGGGVPRGQNGGLLFEDLEFAGAGGDAAAAAAAFGDDVSRRLDQLPPGALERLSQVFQLQRRQAQASAAAAAISVASKGGRGSPSADAVGSAEEREEEVNDADVASGSSGTTGHTTPAPPPAAAASAASAAATAASALATAGGGGAEYDPYSAAGRRHNLEEMFEMMQRSIGNYARNAAAAAAGSANGGGGGDGREKSMGGGAALAGDLGLDPSAYSDPLTQLELFRAMMVATSKGRTVAAGVDGKMDDADPQRARGQRSGGGGGVGGGGAGVAGGRVPGGMDSQANNPFQSFLDVLGPQLFGQVRLQQRAAAGKAAAAVAAGYLGKDADAAAAAVGGGGGGGVPAMARDLDVTASGAANMSDLQKRVDQVRVLSSSTLEELAADEVSDNTSGSLRDLLLGDSEAGLAATSPPPQPELSSAKVGYCLTEAAAVAVSMLWSYQGSPQRDAALQPGWSREAAQSQYNLQLFRLRQELAGLSQESLSDIARCFGGCVAAEVEEIYRAINGVGVLLFFTCKPLALLEKTCGELGISLSDSANADSNVMPELIAEKLAAFLYPMREGKLSFAHLSFLPRMQVHEHAPGNYTCTIDNASNMGRVLRERLLSNRFSCSKIKWRAAVVNDQGELTFLVWHRYPTPLSVHLLVRTSEPKKKKRSGGAADANHHNNGDEREASATDELRANSALFMERQVSAAPGEMVGFTDDFLALTVALSSSTTLQHGYRTYNKADDRLVFQFSLQLSNADGTSLDGSVAPGTANANKSGGKQSTPHPQQQQQAAGDDVEPSVNGSIAGRTDGGDSKEDAEAEARAVIRAFVDTEAAARAVVADAAHLEFRHLQNDECRDAHQSRRRGEERERKALLAKVGPPAELIREVEKLTQAVQAAQHQISKLNKERAKDAKENEKMAEKLSQHQGELSKLMGTLEAGEEELGRLDAETKAAERRIEEKRARLARKEAKKAEQSQWTALKRVLEPTSSSTHHDTLAINDFGSFLQSTVTAAPSSSMPPLAMHGGHGSGGVGGLSAFGTDPFSVRQATATPPSSAANATPVFSTQPKMGMTNTGSSSGLGVNNNNNANSNAAGLSSHHPLLDGMGGVGSSSASTHPGMVSPMMPPSPGVTSNVSAAMGSRNSPASAVAASLGSPGMPLSGMNNNNNSGGNAMGGRSSASPSNAMMMGGVGGGGGGVGGLGGGLSFGLAPSLFSTNPVSHTSHAGMGGGGGMGPGAGPSNLYTSLDANAQPFSPSPPPGSPGTASNSNHSHNNNNGGGGSNGGGISGGGGGFAFTVTAGAGVHPGLTGSSSPLYQASQTFTGSHDLSGHSPSPFSTTPMSSTGNGHFMVNNNNGGGGGAGDVGHHAGAFPQQPHSSSEMLSFSTSLQWRN